MDNSISDELFLAEVAKLPQGRFIRDANALEWLKGARQDPFHNIGWHFSRLTGLGGSEVGTLVMNRRGEFDHLTNARKIVAGKLMMVPPVATESKMTRGNVMEPHTQALSLSQLKAKQRPDLVRAIRMARDPEHPWLRVRPDDVLEIAGLIYPTDYKAPGTPSADGSVHFGYECQTNIYDHLLHLETGNRSDGLLLIELDYQEWCVQAIEVAKDLDLQREILAAGDHAWECVLKGELPKIHFKDRIQVEFNQDELADLQVLEQESLKVGTLAKAVAALSADIGKEYQRVLTREGAHVMKGLDIPASVATPSVRESLDKEGFEALVAAHGLGPEHLTKETSALDAEAMADILQELDRAPVYKRAPDLKQIKDYCAEHQIAAPIKESLSLSLRASKKRGVSAEDITGFQSAARQLAEDVADRVPASADELVAWHSIDLAV